MTKSAFTEEILDGKLQFHCSTDFLSNISLLGQQSQSHKTQTVTRTWSDSVYVISQ